MSDDDGRPQLPPPHPAAAPQPPQAAPAGASAAPPAHAPAAPPPPTTLPAYGGVAALPAYGGVWPPPPPPPVKGPLLRRQWVRVTARWTVAVLLFTGSGAAALKVITDRERSDVPGLATEPDGRWEYPELTLPALPAGAAPPFTERNQHGIHHADPRELLLPAPEGALPHESLPDGEWVDGETFVEPFAQASRQLLHSAMESAPLRHIAARGWTMPDGTESEIYLLRFSTAAAADNFSIHQLGYSGGSVRFNGAGGLTADKAWPSMQAKLGGVRVAVLAEPPGSSDGQTRVAFLQAGDTLGLVIQRNPDDAAEVPFHQTVILQSQLLG